MKKLSPLFLAALILVAFSFSGCISLGGSGKKQVENDFGGIFKSANHGKEWRQKAAISNASGKVLSFASVNVSAMVMDPADSKAIYFGSEAQGLLYTYDGGESWQVATELAKLSQGTVGAIAVDPKNKCTIYASIGNKLFKSEDCNRSWETMYHDTDLTAQIIDIVIDHFNTDVLFVGLNRREGNVIRSMDAGETWQSAYRSKGKLRKLAIDPNDSRKLYAATERDGVYVSANSGQAWERMESLDAVIKEHKLGNDIKDITVTRGAEPMVFLATKAGLLRSDDAGASWEKIELIPSEKDASINAIAVASSSPDMIYYTTGTTFYHSADGGESWATYKLPTARAGWKILLDPEAEGVVYLGVKGGRR